MFGRYVENNLVPGEVICYEARLSPWGYLGRLMLVVFLLGVGGVGVALGFAPVAPVLGLVAVAVALPVLIEYRSTELVVTNRRVVAKRGFIRRRTAEIYLTRVESIDIQQTVVGRVLGYGAVMVSGVGTEGVSLSPIAAPLAFRKAFYAATEAEQNRLAG